MEFTAKIQGEGCEQNVVSGFNLKKSYVSHKLFNGALLQLRLDFKHDLK